MQRFFFVLFVLIFLWCSAAAPPRNVVESYVGVQTEAQMVEERAITLVEVHNNSPRCQKFLLTWNDFVDTTDGKRVRKFSVDADTEEGEGFVQRLGLQKDNLPALLIYKIVGQTIPDVIPNVMPTDDVPILRTLTLTIREAMGSPLFRNGKHMKAEAMVGEPPL